MTVSAGTVASLVYESTKQNKKNKTKNKTKHIIINKSPGVIVVPNNELIKGHPYATSFYYMPHNV